MVILIDGKVAAIKSGTSFDFVSENRFFTDADSYSLEITLPLKGCQQNIDIFGNLHRPESHFNAPHVYHNCVIQDANFYKRGAVAVLEINETEVKIQFLEGRSAQNFDDTLDTIYINELELGYPEFAEGKYGFDTVADAWNTSGTRNTFVQLPWVNNSTSDADVIQNDVHYDEDTDTWDFVDYEATYCDGEEFDWSETEEDSMFAHPTLSAKNLYPSYQWYLLEITKRICKAVGLTYDFTDWENSQWKWLLCCNTLPGAWDVYEMARALPHWSVTEYFEKLEDLLDGFFEIDAAAGTVTFSLRKKVSDNYDVVTIDQVVDEFTSEVSTEEDSSYVENETLKFNDRGDDTWKFLACDWFFEDEKYTVKEYDTLEDFLEGEKSLMVITDTIGEVDVLKNGAEPTDSYSTSQAAYRNAYPYANNAGELIYYVKNIDTYFVLVCWKNTDYTPRWISNRTVHLALNRHMVPQPLNIFGKRSYFEGDEDDDPNITELDCYPVRVDETEDSEFLMFLEPSNYEEAEEITHPFDRDNYSDQRTQAQEEYLADIIHPLTARKILFGDDEKAEYYSTLYVAFWDGAIDAKRPTFKPCPITDSIVVYRDWSYSIFPYSMRLSESIRDSKYKIDHKTKYNFSFVSNRIPEVKSLFYIRGELYLCEKITATFTENGMSHLLKGVFYKVRQ